MQFDNFFAKELDILHKNYPFNIYNGYEKQTKNKI